MHPSPVYTATRSITQTSIRHRRTLLLTFDAFETLFYPSPPVPVQYAAIGHEFGLSRTTVTPDKLKAAFKDAYRVQAKRYPNYGRADVLKSQYRGPKQWWEDVIRGSFGQILATEKNGDSSQTGAGARHHGDIDLPSGMIETLLNRFAGDGGYTLYDDVAPFFARMRELRASSGTTSFDRIVLGVISNSDDRVPEVLKSLGLRVGDTRADEDRSSMELPGFEERDSSQKVQPKQLNATYKKAQPDADLDLVITSYEAGKEKPNKLIFDVAKRQARLLAWSDAHTHGSTPAGLDEADDWTCIHIGDDYQKDYVGATAAGWQSYLLERNGEAERPAGTIRSLMELFTELKIGS
jgi:FMN phosphatase YigB (HAD superfamily)